MRPAEGDSVPHLFMPAAAEKNSQVKLAVILKSSKRLGAFRGGSGKGGLLIFLLECSCAKTKDQSARFRVQAGPSVNRRQRLRRAGRPFPMQALPGGSAGGYASAQPSYPPGNREGANRGEPCFPASRQPHLSPPRMLTLGAKSLSRPKAYAAFLSRGRARKVRCSM